jgi:hypothetical protein
VGGVKADGLGTPKHPEAVVVAFTPHSSLPTTLAGRGRECDLYLITNSDVIPCAAWSFPSFVSGAKQSSA